MSGRAAPLAGGRSGASRAEVVLARALELAGEATPARLELGVEHLRQVAAELEVPAWALASALAEHQVCAGLPHPGALSRLVGPVAVVGWRHVPADPGRTEQLVAAWLDAGHALRVRQLGDGTLVATRRPGPAGSLARAARTLGGGGRDLTGSRGEVRAAVVAADDTGSASVACVLVDVRSRRRAAMGGGGLVGAVGTAGALVGAALVSPVVLAGLPLSIGAGVAVAALHHRSVVRGLTEEVEVTLDHVARRDAPVGPLRELARSMTRRARPLSSLRP